MPTDHNPQHSRRPHYHRGRRGPDRRPGDRRPQPQQQAENAGRDNLDIEQIMREIRTRVSERHGIDLSNQQIQELAARRLEAILDPRIIKPSLIDELRRAAGIPAEAKAAEPEAEYTFEPSTLYDSPNAFLRFARRLLNPFLKLFFNPDALIQALNTQARINKATAISDAEARRRQAEWNGLHYEILRRLVTDIARAGIETGNLALRVESLSAKVDFNERRVRGLEQTQPQPKPSGRATEAPAPSPATAMASRDEVTPSERAPAEGSTDAGRRRRRRRRGRRSGGGQPHDVGGSPGQAVIGPSAGYAEHHAEQTVGDEDGDDDLTSEESGDLLAQAAPAAPEPPALREDQGLGAGDEGSGMSDQEPATSDPRSPIPDPRSGE